MSALRRGQTEPSAAVNVVEVAGRRDSVDDRRGLSAICGSQNGAGSPKMPRPIDVLPDPDGADDDADLPVARLDVEVGVEVEVAAALGVEQRLDAPRRGNCRSRCSGFEPRPSYGDDP